MKKLQYADKGNAGSVVRPSVLRVTESHLVVAARNAWWEGRMQTAFPRVGWRFEGA